MALIGATESPTVAWQYAPILIATTLRTDEIRDPTKMSRNSYWREINS